MTSVSRLLQDNFCGKNSCKSIKYSPNYDTVCQLALLGFKELRRPLFVLSVAASGFGRLLTVNQSQQLLLHVYSSSAVTEFNRV